MSRNRISVLKQAIAAEGWELVDYVPEDIDSDASCIVKANDRLWDIQVCMDGGLALYLVGAKSVPTSWLDMTFPKIRKAIASYGR